jgi:septal ring-binding cell division protein DamX
MEMSKATEKKNKYLLLAGLLALGLALGFLASNWRQSQSLKKVNSTEVKSQSKVENKLVTREASKVINKEVTPPPATPALSNPTQVSPATAPIASTSPAIAQLPQLTIAPVVPVEAKVAPVVAPINNGQADILSRRLIATQNWLSNQPPSTVSIQLMGASSDEQLKADLEKLGQKIELDNIYVFRTKVNNLPFLTVLYGSYINRFEATQALQKLPEEIQKNRPQLRTIAGVLQETK